MERREKKKKRFKATIPSHTLQGLFVTIHGVVGSSIGHKFLLDVPHHGVVAKGELVLEEETEVMIQPYETTGLQDLQAMFRNLLCFVNGRLLMQALQFLGQFGLDVWTMESMYLTVAYQKQPILSISILT